jgi:hypothetical protein
MDNLRKYPELRSRANSSQGISVQNHLEIIGHPN